MDGNIGVHRPRFIAVYMPHGGDADADVEDMYNSIEGLLSEVRALRRSCVLGGDWNATVGAGLPRDGAG
eukprot:7057766-Pyramimonas_sp.AAC.1